MLNDSATPAEDASWELPVKVTARGEVVLAWRHRSPTQSCPTRWSEGSASSLGHLIGDGCLTDVLDGVASTAATTSRTARSSSTTRTLYELFGGASRQDMDNGTVQLRVGSAAVREFFRGLGVTSARAHDKRVPEAIFTAPSEVQAAFLRGLFGADGCVSRSERRQGLPLRRPRQSKRRAPAGRPAAAQRVRHSRVDLPRQRKRTLSKFGYTRNDGTTVDVRRRARVSTCALPAPTSSGSLRRSASRRGGRTTALEALLGETTRVRTKSVTLTRRARGRRPGGRLQPHRATPPLLHRRRRGRC